MKILQAEFIRSCVGSEQFPAGPVPEIAVVGRSNVGKSSLINSLLQRKGLAKVSRTPGKTRAVNLFAVATDDPTATPLELDQQLLDSQSRLAAHFADAAWTWRR